jgi:phosphoribosyl-AMP cyclohydrolase
MIKVDFAKGNGLVPVIVQEASSKDVLMLAYMNEESLRQTLETGIATYYSRSRQGLWVKGETSGHYQYVKEIKIDCDEDTILLIVDQVGAACHTGAHSCFYRDLKG